MKSDRLTESVLMNRRRRLWEITVNLPPVEAADEYNRISIDPNTEAVISDANPVVGPAERFDAMNRRRRSRLLHVIDCRSDATTQLMIVDAFQIAVE
ncbi:MAG: hypothetical protein WBC44_03435 [Planctomycetaceae bacterium]